VSDTVEPGTLIDSFVMDVLAMRDAQVAYFKACRDGSPDRTSLLFASKEAERLVDKHLKHIAKSGTDGQKGLAL
jgi:hypothetical protein